MTVNSPRTVISSTIAAAFFVGLVITGTAHAAGTSTGGGQYRTKLRRGQRVREPRINQIKDELNKASSIAAKPLADHNSAREALKTCLTKATA
ncbi:hypothetical protein U9R90_02905 [Streptomyces sp. E11-3]|uniref:hypothetical protein n=1 Tax=Streptomyces sp. E11-3 TaxID=3110112 RepID=UPI00397FB302